MGRSQSLRKEEENEKWSERVRNGSDEGSIRYIREIGIRSEEGVINQLIRVRTTR